MPSALFSEFVDQIHSKRRYLFAGDAPALLDFLNETGKALAFTVTPQDEFWRAVLAHDAGTTIADLLSPPKPCCVERIFPLRHSAKEGRVNPIGIPCLYVATETSTAIAEVGPNCGAYLTLAQMRPKQNLQIINFSKTNIAGSLSTELQNVWLDINEAFARPVQLNEQFASYATTQIISELFKSMGYDGVCFSSSQVKEGYNLAFFGIDTLEVSDRQLHHIDAVQYSTTII